MSKVDDLLADEGSQADKYQTPVRLPEHVTVSRPNLGRGVVVSVRLSGEEHAQLQRAAADANLPVSTLIRVWALNRVDAEREGGTVSQRLERLERHVFQRTA